MTASTMHNLSKDLSPTTKRKAPHTSPPPVANAQIDVMLKAAMGSAEDEALGQLLVKINTFARVWDQEAVLRADHMACFPDSS